MIGAPNTQGQKYWVGIVQWAPKTSVSEEIADIFRNYNIDVGCWASVVKTGSASEEESVVVVMVMAITMVILLIILHVVCYITEFKLLLFGLSFQNIILARNEISEIHQMAFNGLKTPEE